MKKQPNLPCAVVLAVAAILGFPLAQAAPIPKLYNTGVDEAGAPLAAGVVDSHYTLVESADPGSPGPQAFTLIAGFPVPPWIAEGPLSRWIAPSAQQGTGNLPGNYTFRTTFDLTGFDPAKARIAGKWAVDNTGIDIILNGNFLGLSNAAGFGGFTDFTIESGFQEGVNTLEFVLSNAGDAVNPAGIRIEMIGTVEIAGEAPRIVTQPSGGTYLEGEDVSLSVVADGTPPLAYQWRRNGSDVAGATEPTLALPAITVAQDGEYTVQVSNGSGQATSDPARVTVLERLAGLFDTGVDNSGLPLFDYDPDPHYELVTNPHDPSVTSPVVQDSTLFPIVAGPWIANNDTSKWIGPVADTVAGAAGDYVYEIEVNLANFDPTTAFIAGTWATDNTAVLLLNGAPTGQANSGNFNTLSAFRIDTGFLSGLNKIQFQVNNASLGYTGLRVQNLRGGAKRGTAGNDPRIVAQPLGGLALVGESFTLTAIADGTQPLSYQWQRNGSPLTGKTDASLTLANITHADAGDYTLVVTNSRGSATTSVASITVLDRVPGVFNTGVDAAGAVLGDGAVDPHYRLVVNATDPASQDAFVHDSTIFPIVAGPWLANTDKSKWIAPVTDSSTASGGDYAYRTTFDLTGFDPATAILQGGWATDNVGTDIKLNGTSLALQNTTQFSALTPLTITSGFVAGVNRIEFQVNNSDAVTGYTGLRTDNLRVGARVAGGTGPTLTIARRGNDLALSWPTSFTGFALKSANALPASSWGSVSASVAIEGDQNVVTLPPAAATQFYRLEK